MLNPKRADAEGSRSRADGSKRPHYSYLSPTPIYDTPRVKKWGPKVSKEKAKSNGFSARLWASLFQDLRLWFEDGEAEATRNRSFGDVPDQPGRRSGPDYLGR